MLLQQPANEPNLPVLIYISSETHSAFRLINSYVGSYEQLFSLTQAPHSPSVQQTFVRASFAKRSLSPAAPYSYYFQV